MSIHLRADRAVFRFSGPEAHKLVNDVLTGRIPDSVEQIASWWALLSPQGKVLAEGVAGFADDAIWVDVHQSVADDFFKRMKMYRLRAQVVIDDLRTTHRVGFAQGDDPGFISHTDRSGPIDFGYRTIAPLEATTDWLTDDTHYHAERISAGIPQLGPDFGPNEVFAHDIGMDLLDGIDFVKGCYVGQEVVSRMKHRGTARRRPVIVSGTTAPAGSIVSAGGRDAGTIGQVVDGKAVAILRLDRIADLDAVSIDRQPVHLALPIWANYQFGEVSAED